MVQKLKRNQKQNWQKRLRMLLFASLLSGLFLSNVSGNILVNSDFSADYAGTLGWSDLLQTSHADNGWYKNPNTSRCFTTRSNGAIIADGSSTGGILQIVNDNNSLTGSATFSIDVYNSDSDVNIRIYGYNGGASTVDSKLTDTYTRDNPVNGSNADATLLSASLAGGGSASWSTETFSVDMGTGYDYIVIGISANADQTNDTRVDNVTLSGSTGGSADPIPGVIEAENYSAMSGIQTEPCSEGGENVGWIDNGDWMDYEVDVASAGDYTIDFRVAASSNNIKFDLKEGGTVLTSVNSASTGGWQNWKTVTKSVSLSAGVQTLRIAATGGGWNINYMEFTSGGSEPSYTLTVNNGSGDGTYTEGTVVDIAADAAPAGQVFDNWTGNTGIVADVNNPTTTATIPAWNTELTANYKSDGGGGDCTTDGQITYQKWDGISGTAVSDLTGNSNFPDNPSSTSTRTSMEAPTNVDDNYGARLIGTICAPETGTYYFWIAADDNCELWLSSDENESNESQIAGHTDWTSSREWNKYTSQKSSGISLTAGNKYFIEAIMKEGTGGDNLAVGWRKPSDGNGTSPVGVIPGSALSEYAGGGGEPTYTLTVNNGSGDGTYTEGTVVDIAADAAPAGQVFDNWTGNTGIVADVNNPTTTATIPAWNTELTANYKSDGGGGNANSPIGTNLSGLAAYAPERPFINLAKQGRWWTSFNSIYKSDNLPDSDVDENGYLEPGKTGQFAVLWDMSGAINGNYVCTYDGTGDVQFNYDQSGVSEVSNTTGRVESNCNNASFLIVQVTNNSSSDPVRNIWVGEKQFEGTSETFHPDFLANWTDMKVIRFMDWMETNNSHAQYWSDRPLPQDLSYTYKGGKVPVEVMIELANLVQADPWFCMPHKATDNYMQQFATIVKNNLDPALKIYIEYSNEVWNGQFGRWDYDNCAPQEEGQYSYAIQKSIDKGWTTCDKPWTGAEKWYPYRSVQMFQVWESVFGSADRLVRLLSCQAAVPGKGESMMDFSVSEWNGQTAADFADAFAVAPYFGGTISRDDNFVSNHTVDEILDECLKQIRNEPFIGTDDMSIRMQQNIDNAAVRGLKCLAYEGGQHLATLSKGNQALVDKLIDCNRAPRMKDLYVEYFETWLNYGGDLFASFSSVSVYNEHGSWGVKEYMTDTRSESPKYDGLLTVIENNPVTWGDKFFSNTKSAKLFKDSEDYKDLAGQQPAKVYPNPASEDFTIKSNKESGWIFITDLSGKTVHNERLTNHLTKINSRNLAPGLYIITITSETGTDKLKINIID